MPGDGLGLVALRSKNGIGSGCGPGLRVEGDRPASSSGGPYEAELATHRVLEGRLVGPWVAELQAAVMAAGSLPGRVHLDLSGVHFVDAQGLTLLHRLQDQGVVLQTLSPFIQELLNTSLEA